MSSCVTNSSLATSLGSYVTKTSASSLYQPVSAMCSYVTNSSLATSLGSI